MATPSTFIDQPTQRLEKLRNTMHFIKHNQLVFMLIQIACRISQLAPI